MQRRHLLALVGPPGGLPAQVPGFVGDVLGEIGSLAGGAMDSIGETIRSLTPGGADSASEAATGKFPGPVVFL